MKTKLNWHGTHHNQATSGRYKVRIKGLHWESYKDGVKLHSHMSREVAKLACQLDFNKANNHE